MTATAAYDPRHSLNAICPYFTMFPLEFPLRSLERVPFAEIIADPFCGRGTTLYAARDRGLQTYGVDCSPVAVAISKAKLAVTTLDEVVSLAEDLIESGSPANSPEGEFWSLAYHKEVLHDITVIRQGLLRQQSAASSVLRAVMMGILHGPKTSVGSYLSNQMQRTFAPKPDYAVKFWNVRKLSPTKVDVLAAVKRKATNVFKSPAFRFTNMSLSDVCHGDATDDTSWETAPRQIDAVVTSPPYYGMRTYVPDQWLRNWFIGGPSIVDYSDAGRLPSSSLDEFAKSLAKVWDNVGDRAGADLHMFIRFGVLPSRKIDARDLLFSSFEESRFNWKRIYTQNASTASSGRRQATQMKGSDNAESEFDAHLRLI